MSLPDIQYPEFGSDAHKERACTRGDQVKVLGTGAAHFQYTALHAEQGVGAILAGTCNLDAATGDHERELRNNAIGDNRILATLAGARLGILCAAQLVALSIDNKI